MNEVIMIGVDLAKNVFSGPRRGCGGYRTGSVCLVANGQIGTGRTGFLSHIDAGELPDAAEAICGGRCRAAMDVSIQMSTDLRIAKQMLNGMAADRTNPDTSAN